MQLFEWWASKTTAYKEQRAIEAQQEQERLSFQAINVMEFNGQLYIASNGVPVVPASSLSKNIEDVVADSRKSYLEWKSRFKPKSER